MHCLKQSPSTLLTTLTVIALLLIAVVWAGQAPAAAGPPGGGTCDPIIDPSCTVTVTLPGAPGRGGSTNNPGTGHDGTTQGPADNVCHNTDPRGGCNPCPPNGTAAPDPAACAAYSQNLFCSQLNPAGVDPAAWQILLQTQGCAGNTYTPVNPAVLAQQALATIRFPHPSGDRSPRQTLTYQGHPFSYVNLWTFFWTDPGVWHPLSATASVGEVSATVTARPVELVFDPGDGNAAVACAGPGRPWAESDGNSPPSDGACGYRYTKVTSGPITSTQTIVWQITWVGTGNTSGEIPSLSTSTSGQLQVLQIQVVTR